MKKFVGSLIRHGLTAIGAILINKGLMDQAGVEQIASISDVLAGLLLALFGLLWSHLRNRRLHAK
jgi:hypothetical protein